MLHNFYFGNISVLLSKKLIKNPEIIEKNKITYLKCISINDKITQIVILSHFRVYVLSEIHRKTN